MRFKSYSTYKETGVKWIREIPDQWNLNKIKFTSYVKGRIGWQGLTTQEYVDDGPYLVTGTDFQNGTIEWDSCCHVSEDRYNQDRYIQLKENDLLITKDGTIGKVALVRNLHGKATLNSGVLVIRPITSDYITSFMYWILISNIFSSYIDYIKTGTTISHLYQVTFDNFSFQVPSQEEQQQISSFLDIEVSRINLSIEGYVNLIKMLQEKRIALISHIVIRGLDPDVKMKDSGVEWIGKIPKLWEVIPLTKYLESIVDYRGATPQKTDNGVFLITGKNIKSGIIDYELSKEYVSSDEYNEIMHRGKPKIGDLLFTTEAPLGEVANIDNEEVALAQRIIKMRGKRGILDNYYLKYFIMSESFQNHLKRFSTGSTAIGIKASKLSDLRILLPPVQDQLIITDYLNKATLKIDTIIEKIKKQIGLLNEYKTSLISYVVTGKIDVREEVKCQVPKNIQ